jgi:hypothetical protein
MRITLSALGLAAGLGLICSQSASAYPVDAAAIQQAASAASGIEHVQYYDRRTRHGYVKCYRDFVIGRYGCHRY